VAGFEAGGVVGVIEKSDLLADERDGSFVETAGQSDGAVFGDAAAGLFAEVILEIFGRCAHTLAVSGIACQRCLLGAAVLAVVVDISQPAIEREVEIVKSLGAHRGKKIAAHGAKKPLDFAFALGLGPGVDQGDAQGGTDLVEVKRAKGGAVVDVEFARQAASQKGLAQSVEVAIEILA